MSFIHQQQIISLAGFYGTMIKVNFNPDEFDPVFYRLSGINDPFVQQKVSRKRQAEFLAGRIAAQAALAMLGISPEYQSVGINKHHAPVWPKGITGSISHHHTAAYAVVAATSQYSAIGVDAEQWLSTKVAGSTQDLIINTEEKALLHHPVLLPEQVLTLIFSAKESLYKALHPKVRQYFDFLDARILAINIDKQNFVIQLNKSLNFQFYQGKQFIGKFLLDKHEVITLIAIEYSQADSL